MARPKEAAPAKNTPSRRSAAYGSTVTVRPDVMFSAIPRSERAVLRNRTGARPTLTSTSARGNAGSYRLRAEDIRILRSVGDGIAIPG